MSDKKILLPSQLIKQHDFGPKIELINQKVYTHIEYLKNLISKTHKIYGNLSKQIIKLTQIYEQKLSKSQGTNSILVNNFFRSLRDIYFQLDQQVSKNNIYITTKKNDNIKNTHEVIIQKIKKVIENVEKYKQLIQQYNTLAEKYFRKAERFQQIDKDPIQFYSLKKNKQTYEKLKTMEDILENKLEEIHKLKSQIKTSFIQISIKIKYYFDSVKNKVDQFRQIMLILRVKVNSLEKIKDFGKIDEVSQQAEYSVFSTFSISPKNTNDEGKKRYSPARKISTEIDVKLLKRQTIKQFQQHSFIQNTLISFLNDYLIQLGIALQKIGQVQKEKEFKKFSSERLVMIEFLDSKTIDNIDIIVYEIGFLQQILEKMILMCTPTIYQELLKYRTHILERYSKQMDQLLAADYELYQLTERHTALDKKYSETNKQSRFRFGEKVNSLLESIKGLFSQEVKMIKGGSKPADQQIFGRTYYEILKLPYFMNGEKVGEFNKDQRILKYEKIQKYNKFQQAQFQMASEMQPQKKKEKVSVGCCGLSKLKEKKSKKKKKIDSFSCALKDGYMLFQGKIQLYDQYLRFVSSFNPQKFFSDTDICIPKWDIRQIIKGKHLVSLLVVIVTKNGNIQFTSFFSDPINLLVELYCSRTNFSQKMVTFPDECEFDELQKCFQDSFINDARDKKIFVDKFSTQKQQKSDRKTLLVRYQYHETKRMDIHAFQVTIHQFENAIEYTFFHSESQKKVQTMNLLETLAKNMIHRERKKKFDDQFNQNHLRIEKKETQFSFQLNNMSLIKNKQSFNFDHSMARDLQIFNKPVLSSSKIVAGFSPKIQQNLRTSEKHHGRKESLMEPILQRDLDMKENTVLFENDLMNNSGSIKEVSSSALTIKQKNRNKGKKLEEEKIIQQKRIEGIKTLLMLIGLGFMLLWFFSKLI